MMHAVKVGKSVGKSCVLYAVKYEDRKIKQEEDRNGQHAQEDGLLMNVAAPSTPSSSGSQSSSKSSRRICLRPDCTRVLGSSLPDSHSVCVNCIDICNPAVPSSSDLNLMQFSVPPPPKSPDAKKVCAVTPSQGARGRLSKD
ncbi:hypothetical protein E2C01_014703 [Portunus trituberculatus]|uniref:Uncharacterized protein n=1 Tax=Portunus trituberculatus TaxID=210409 RepID=A0A5B7DKX0_PORTR|nr:hypothetical protein [Portunus trituberculatus]